MSTTPDLDTPPPCAACPLLELPAELRNEIYGLVLCKNYRIVVSSTGYEREGLLSVCKQVRQEALKIYYYENKFAVEVHKWDSDNLLDFEKVVRRLGLGRNQSRKSENQQGPKAVRLYCVFPSLAPSWRNLLEWVRRIHSAELCGPSRAPEDLARQENVLFGLKGLTAMAFTACQLYAQPWSLVKEVLRGHRALLAQNDSKWLDD